jgi:hypothetical protein
MPRMLYEKHWIVRVLCCRPTGKLESVTPHNGGTRHNMAGGCRSWRRPVDAQSYAQLLFGLEIAQFNRQAAKQKTWHLKINASFRLASVLRSSTYARHLSSYIFRFQHCLTPLSINVSTVCISYLFQSSLTSLLRLVFCRNCVSSMEVGRMSMDTNILDDHYLI